MLPTLHALIRRTLPQKRAHFSFWELNTITRVPRVRARRTRYA